MSDLSPTRVLRRTLEDALETHMASTVLFEALGLSGSDVPQTIDDVLSVVRGPLRAVLDRHLDAGEASLLIDRIEAQLMPAMDDPPTLEVPLDELIHSTRRDEATAVFPTVERAVRALVLAGGGGFARRLEVTLGEDRVAPTSIAGTAALKQALRWVETREAEPPAILLVDASDFPAIDRGALLAAAVAMPRTTACVLWGVELPYGRSFAASIEAQERRWVTLELREGIAPLLDLIRSRRRGRSE